MRILMLGDSPFLHTGFGVVNRIAMDTLLDEGHELVILGGQDLEERSQPNVTFVPVNGQTADMIGWAKVPEVLADHKPDAISIIGDPTSVCNWMIHPEVMALPKVAYMPVEGAPMNVLWVKALTEASDLRLITCSNYGRDLLASCGIEAKMAYHGVSLDFQPETPMVRDEKRKLVGWDDKFIVMCVAQNVRRKQWPRLIEAIAILKKRHPELYLYAHTVPFNNYWLGGHDLGQLVHQLGVAERVQFSTEILTHNAAIALHSKDGKPGLIDLYQMADAFVLPSQVEGFGLPLVEAMACGLPVITTDYAAGAEVVGDAALKIPVHDWEVNQSHARYANVAPLEVAKQIERFIRSPELRKRYGQKGSERAKLFRWDDYKQELSMAFRDVEALLQVPTGDN